MSEHDQNKSEEASAYKLAQARKKGMVPKSQELGMVFAVACCAGYLAVRGNQISHQLAHLSARSFAEAGNLSGGGRALIVWMGSLFAEAAHIMAPLIFISLGGALVATVIQIGFMFAPDALKVDLSRLNPVQGLKRIFSVQILIEAAKACAKMVVYVAIAAMIIADVARTVSHADTDALHLAIILKSSGLHLLWLFLLAALLFAAADQIIVRRMFAKKMRMSRHELKQEIKQREGDPRIKQRRKQLQRELLQRSQSMRGVRGADVLVTNPTHIAVGLKYEAGKMAAPVVVAKGAGDFALRLRRLAFIYGVPIIESRALARQLFKKSLLEREIPGELYRDTAMIYLRVQRAAKKAVHA